MIYGKNFCQQQIDWLTGNACMVLGVISTVGSQLSLFAMTTLSLVRMFIVFRKSPVVPSRVKKTVITKAALIVSVIVVTSLIVACVPLIPTLEDYFVQGMFYDPEYKLFIGFPSKVKHLKILNAYYNETFPDDTSWTDIAIKVDNMFSSDNGTLSRKPVHFYGNDGLCLFKYFVRSDDPRNSRFESLNKGNIVSNEGNAMVWTMLGINLFCFMLIAVSYIIINVKTQQSSKSSGQDKNPVRMRENRAIQARIAIIIGTDFACWVPFIIICSLHNLVESFDATNWYSTFAMIVLPINSVINPVLYDKTISEFVGRKVRGTIAVIRNLRMVRFFQELRRNEREAVGDYQMVDTGVTRLEGSGVESRDPPGTAALAEQIHFADNVEEGTSPDVRELEVAAPEDIVMDTEM
jgi:hypothetical protein